MNEINQDGESSSSRRSTPLFHVAGDSTILAIDTHRRSSPGTQGFNKGSTNVPGSDREGTFLFFGNTSTSCTEAIMGSNEFSADGYMIISLRSSFAFPEPDPLMSTLPCSMGLVQLFVHLYFTHVHPQIPMINKRNFIKMQESRYKDNLLLLNSMCAIVTQKTSILSTYGIKNANELHRTFFERAKCLLEKRFDWPQINTIQALIILSLLGSGMNNAASAYQYIGIACRQAIELGMHKNISLVRSSPESHTCSEKVSHLTWLCLYIVDRYVSTYLGRPLAVSDHDVTISLPNCDSNTTPAGNLSLHVKLCAILGKISDAINRSSNLSVMKTEDLLKTFNNLKPKLLSMQSYVPTPKGSDSWSVNHHLYLLYRASYILLHRLTPGLIDISCVNRAIEISRLLSPILLSNHSEEVERFDYKEYVFIMPVVVYFALTGASLLLDVYIKQTFKRPNSKEQTLSNSESASARDDPKLHLPSDLNLKDEIMKFVTIFDKLKDVSLYSVYYKKIIVEGLNSLMTHQSESTTIVPQTPTNTPDSSPHVRDSNPPSSYDPESQDNGLLSMLVDLGHRPEIDDFFAYRHPLINYRNHAQPPAPDPSTVGTLGCVQRSSQRAKRISNPTSKIACDTSDNNTPQALPVSQGPILPRADPAKSVDTFTTAQDWINWDKPADYLQKSSCPYDADVLPTEKPPFQVPRNDPAIQFLELNECWKSLNSRGGYELLIDEEYNN